MRTAARLAAVFLIAALPGSASALHLPGAPRCAVFPRTNPWNQRVDKLPVAANSATMIRSIGLDTGPHADVGAGRWAAGPCPRAEVGVEPRVEADRADHRRRVRRDRQLVDALVPRIGAREDRTTRRSGQAQR